MKKNLLLVVAFLMVANLFGQKGILGLAPFGDLACVYGTIKYNNKTDNYIRIWKRELSNGWKIVLELLRY